MTGTVQVRIIPARSGMLPMCLQGKGLPVCPLRASNRGHASTRNWGARLKINALNLVRDNLTNCRGNLEWCCAVRPCTRLYFMETCMEMVVGVYERIPEPREPYIYSFSNLNLSALVVCVHSCLGRRIGLQIQGNSSLTYH